MVGNSFSLFYSFFLLGGQRELTTMKRLPENLFFPVIYITFIFFYLIHRRIKKEWVGPCRFFEKCIKEEEAWSDGMIVIPAFPRSGDIDFLLVFRAK